MNVDEYFATGPAWERPIFEAVLAEVRALGSIHVEPVSVRIFIKSTGGWIQLRPASEWVSLWFPMSRPIDHPRIARKPIQSGQRFLHMVKLTGPAEVDDLLRAWLAESYADFG